MHSTREQHAKGDGVMGETHTQEELLTVHYCNMSQHARGLKCGGNTIFYLIYVNCKDIVSWCLQLYIRRCGAFFTALYRHGRGEKGDGD